MKRWMGAFAVPALGFALLLLAPRLSAQSSGQITGQVLDFGGQPYIGVLVTITADDTGSVLTTKTDKNGHYVQLGLRSGVYSVNFKPPDGNPDTTRKVQVTSEGAAELSVDFKKLAAESGSFNPSAKEKAAAEANAFKNMKTHFDAGVAAMTDYRTVKTQSQTAAADQKPALKEKMMADCKNAANEFQEAEKGIGPKDQKNHAVVLGQLGSARDCAEDYAGAADAFQKAIDMSPAAPYYLNHATDTAKNLIADPKLTDAKLDEVLTLASADCDKGVALDPTSGGNCYYNVGIVFSNKGRMKQASAALLKATQVDPKNADAWFFLGGAYLALMDTKEAGGKITYIIQPGTAEAYQKYLELAPTGPRAAEAKENLATIESLQGGSETTVLKRKKK
jgi:tetratricopeptide (TPR) repeat protein